MIKSLYIHIPFCSNKCNYCDFTSYPNKESDYNQYIETLIRELKYKKEKYNLSSLNTIYIGGGTPTVLPLYSLEKLLSSIKESFNFSLEYEFTVEGNPESITKSKIDLMKKYGVNRISMGVQSFNEDILKFLGRCHTKKQVLEAYNAARESGLANINIDLIYGIPGESFFSWQETLNSAVKLSPEHISVYQLKIEEGTPFYKELINGKIESYPDDLAEEIYNWNLKYLEGKKYNNYEFSNFAKTGFSSKHNMNYWNYLPYAAAGFGAVGFYGDYRSQIKESFKDYLELKEFHQENYFIEKLTKEDQITEYIIMNLRKTKGFSLKDFQRRFNVSFLEIYSKQVEKFSKGNYIKISNDEVFFTLKGRLISNLILEEFV